MWALWLTMRAAGGGFLAWRYKEKVQAAIIGTAATAAKLRALARKLEDDLRGH